MIILNNYIEAVFKKFSYERLYSDVVNNNDDYAFKDITTHYYDALNDVELPTYIVLQNNILK